MNELLLHILKGILSIAIGIFTIIGIETVFSIKFEWYIMIPIYILIFYIIDYIGKINNKLGI